MLVYRYYSFCGGTSFPAGGKNKQNLQKDLPNECHARPKSPKTAKNNALPRPATQRSNRRLHKFATPNAPHHSQIPANRTFMRALTSVTATRRVRPAAGWCSIRRPAGRWGAIRGRRLSLDSLKRACCGERSPTRTTTCGTNNPKRTGMVTGPIQSGQWSLADLPLFRQPKLGDEQVGDLRNNRWFTCFTKDRSNH